MIEQILIAAAFVISMFFGWAIGGEHGFGKGKRGLLLAIPMTLFFLPPAIPLLYLALQVLILYGIYQTLKYDTGINLVYDQGKWYGWLIIGANGALIGCTPIMLAAATANYTGFFTSIIAGILGFCGVVILSNDKRLSGWRTWCSQHLPWKFKDAWFICEGLMGAILGIVIKFFW